MLPITILVLLCLHGLVVTHELIMALCVHRDAANPQFANQAAVLEALAATAVIVVLLTWLWVPREG